MHYWFLISNETLLNVVRYTNRNIMDSIYELKSTLHYLA